MNLQFMAENQLENITTAVAVAQFPIKVVYTFSTIPTTEHQIISILHWQPGIFDKSTEPPV